MDGQTVPLSGEDSAVAPGPVVTGASGEPVQGVGPFPLPLVVIAASAGGIPALITVLGALPRGFAGAVLVVQHLDPHHPSHLVEIVRRHCRLEVEEAGQSTPVRPGTVYLAPPDRHIMIGRDGWIRLDTSPPVHHLRPSADVLFSSAATAADGRVIAVVLTGTGTDGADGVRAVKVRGGAVVVQDPTSSEFAGMPSSAVATGVADHVLPLERIGEVVVALAGDKS